jgi:hypothetical protein
VLDVIGDSDEGYYSVAQAKEERIIETYRGIRTEHSPTVFSNITEISRAGRTESDVYNNLHVK